jgi:DMSO reductase family type II enzyme chaperone
MNSTTSSLDQDISAIDSALCRATAYSALALAFRPPTDEIIARIIEPENTAALAAAAAAIDVDGKLNLAAAVEASARAGRIGVAHLDSCYRALFGHTAHGTVPPYETEYGNEALFQQPQELGDLMGFYRAFGLTVKFDQHERADHISCECEFLSFLAMKEAYALEHRDPAMLEDTRKAQKLFLRDHLGRFLPTFAQQLSRENAGGFYAKIADFCLRFISHETNRLGTRLGATNLPLRPANDERVPMACGSGAVCAAMPGACVPEGADSV